MLDLHDQIKNLLISSDTKTILKKAFARIFEDIANSDKSVLFNLNIYIDYCLQKGFKARSDEEIDNELDRIIELFCHLQEKDIFEVYFKKLLSKRLIS